MKKGKVSKAVEEIKLDDYTAMKISREFIRKYFNIPENPVIVEGSLYEQTEDGAKRKIRDVSELDPHVIAVLKRL